jgi:Rrf2 family iron-sulfur cluster assembly transcriptional regulator
VTVADIVRAVDEPLDATQCGGKENCLDDQRCMTHDLWAALNAKMYDYLSSVTLAGLVDRQRAKEARRSKAAIVEDRRLGPQPKARNGRDKVAAVI